jgi:hypothetical protein
MEEVSPRLDDQATEQRTYERNDVNVRGIVVFGLGLVIAAVLIHLLMWWLLNTLTVREAVQERPLSPLAVRPGESVPPEPRLQISPTQDMQALRAAEETLLHSYGWVDQPAGVVRIPIERAMQVLVERGFPTRVQQEPQRTTGQSDNGEKSHPSTAQTGTK